MNISLVGLSLPLRLRPETPMSDEQLMAFCAANDVLRVERDANGEVIVMTPAGNRTGRRNAYLLQVLGSWADQDGRGYAFDSSTGFTLPDGSMRSPDAAWILAERWDALSGPEKDRFSPICPEFIVELRSETDRIVELEAKMADWISNGVQLAWLIDPQRQMVTVYCQRQPPEVHFHGASIRATGVMADFELNLTRIWA